MPLNKATMLKHNVSFSLYKKYTDNNRISTINKNIFDILKNTTEYSST